MIVSHNAQSAFAPTLQEALAQIFPGFDTDLGDRIRVADDPPIDSGDDEPIVDDTDEVTDEEPVVDTGDRPALPDDATPAELLEEADALYDIADEQLRAGDLAAYQEALDEARVLIQRALDQLEG